MVSATIPTGIVLDVWPGANVNWPLVGMKSEPAFADLAIVW